MTKTEREERLKKRLMELKSYDCQVKSRGYKYIVGIDEVGRGPLAGPVVSAAVVLPEEFSALGIDDSKKISEKKRNELAAVIKKEALAYGLGWSDNRRIDEINIREATKEAMFKAFSECMAMLEKKRTDDVGSLDGVSFVLVDGDMIFSGELKNVEPVVKGDSKSLSIAAASILAKVARDNYMIEMDEKYKGYDFVSNKGYGTKKHYEGLNELGITDIHRKSFLRNWR
ncbi:MAG: ribonuclease HII [Peptostreptococcaceae bacterium]|nr:ribonuclease HII [Peptostreptococcaceae bacterium]MDY5739658.1 ribonuclease HII [Anaerovoracaceae bacterium]